MFAILVANEVNRSKATGQDAPLSPNLEAKLAACSKIIEDADERGRTLFWAAFDAGAHAARQS